VHIQKALPAAAGHGKLRVHRTIVIDKYMGTVPVVQANSKYPFTCSQCNIGPVCVEFLGDSGENNGAKDAKRYDSDIYTYRGHSR
jgi:hypothetical protein